MDLDIGSYNLDSDAQRQMYGALQKIATGPHLSKDLSLEETSVATANILNGSIDPVRSAMFFIALRMKRETMAENQGILDAIIRTGSRKTVDVPELVDIAEPYNGFNRILPASPFLPAVLASLGIPAYSHGVDTVGPKYGVTHRLILEAGGINPDLTVDEAAQKISQFGWAYIDQAQFCPGLHALKDFRKVVIKRLPLTTCEVMAAPLRANDKTHIVTGFVHKGYQEVYAGLARFAGFDSALIVKGTEGGITPSLRQQANCYSFHGQEQEREVKFNPEDFCIDHESRAPELPDGLNAPNDNREIAKQAFDNGMKALQGVRNSAYKSLVYSASLILSHLGRYDSDKDRAQAVFKTLDNGNARDSFLALV